MPPLFFYEVPFFCFAIYIFIILLKLYGPQYNFFKCHSLSVLVNPFRKRYHNASLQFLSKFNWSSILNKFGKFSPVPIGVYARTNTPYQLIFLLFLQNETQKSEGRRGWQNNSMSTQGKNNKCYSLPPNTVQLYIVFLISFEANP